MSVSCGHCGEPLMGAVNRCWRCGHEFAQTAEDGRLPPVRRPGVGLVDPADQPSVITRETNSAADTDVMRPVIFRLGGWEVSGPEVCAYLSVVLGGIGSVAGWFTWLMVVPAVLGVGLGVLGLKSARREIATTGIILSCIGVLASAVNVAQTIYAGYLTRQLIDDFPDEAF
jgi:hypothetical protein